MNLVCDFGNTFAKLYLFEMQKIVRFFKLNYSDIFIEKKQENKKKCYTAINEAFLEKCLTKFSFSKIIVSSVIDFPEDLNHFFKQNYKINTLIELNPKTPIPLTNLYENKETLGKDRLAAAVGANYLFPNRNILVVDAGSAITFEFISERNEYLGGTISPGFQMRFKALNTFTKKLPLITLKEEIISVKEHKIFAKNTIDAIQTGVINSMVFEIEAYIEKAQKKFNNLKLIITGGDTFFFEKNIKNNIFAEPNLVAMGLNAILNYNTQTQV